MNPPKTIIIFPFIFLVVSTIISAQVTIPGVHLEGSTNRISTTEPEIFGGQKPPFFGDFNFDWLPAAWLTSLSSLGSGFHGLHSSGNSLPGSQVPDLFSLGSGTPTLPNRQKRSPEERKVIRCDFSKGPTACVSCSQVRRCYPMNYGTISTCSGIFRYCRYGRCSNTPGALCKTTTLTSSSTPVSTRTSLSSSTTESTTSSTSSSMTSLTSPSTAATSVTP